ncbi:MAG: VWA domain-containing protein [Verrucomicrobiaceae bacterium]|nr:VWA domain-containing protein [Verrucomicrobiaceae bacterium]
MASAQNREKAILILDASGSMWGEVDKRAKIDVAKQVVIDLVSSWNYKIDLGLMVYGHRSKSDCADIELMIPPGPVDASVFRQKVGAILPRGKTPLTRSVIQAAELLRYSEEKATVILVTDGIETCGEDPCAAAEALEAAGVDFKAHVIGFALKPAEQATIDCLARKTGGLSLTAKNAAELKNALAAVAKATVESTPPPPPLPPPPPPPPPPSDGKKNVKVIPVLYKGGDPVDAWVIFAKPKAASNIKGTAPVASGSSEVGYRLLPGKYILLAEWGGAEVTQEIVVPETENFEVTVILNAGTVVFTAVDHEGGQPVQTRYYSIFPDPKTQPNAKMLDGGGDPRFRLPAGTYLVDAQLAHAVRARQTFTIEAGEVTEVALNYNAGTVVFTAVDHEGGQPVQTRYYSIFPDPKTQPNAKMLDGGGDPRFRPPAGTYLVDAQLAHAVRARQTFTIEAGEVTEVALNYNAGTVVFTSVAHEGGQPVKTKYYSIFPDPKTQPNAKMLDGGGDSRFRLPAGTYLVKADWASAVDARQTFTVEAGRVSEVTLNYNAGTVRFAATTHEGGQPVKVEYYSIYPDPKTAPDGKMLTGDAGPEIRLPAGTYLVEARWGNVRTRQTFTVKAGETADVPVILDAGTLELTTHVGAADSPNVNNVVYFIYEAAGGVKGRQVTNGSGNRFQLKAGSYIIEINHQGRKATQAAEIKAGQTQKAALVLPAQ